MRLTVVTVALVLLVFTASASAASPATPAPGSAFTTTDTVTFVAQSTPDESEYVFVFSKGAVFRKTQWFALGGEDDGDGLGDELELDLGWLATKFDHIGTYSWALCPVAGPDQTVMTDQCSAPSTFSVRFRLPRLTSSAARSDARYVMQNKFRSYWRGFYGRSVSCARATRTRQRCKVSGFAGDAIVSGTMTIYLKRERSWSLPHFRARIRLIDDYCYSVEKKPLRDCQTVRKRSGRV